MPPAEVARVVAASAAPRRRRSRADGAAPGERVPVHVHAATTGSQPRAAPADAASGLGSARQRARSADERPRGPASAAARSRCADAGCERRALRREAEMALRGARLDGTDEPCRRPCRVLRGDAVLHRRNPTVSATASQASDRRSALAPRSRCQLRHGARRCSSSRRRPPRRAAARPARARAGRRGGAVTVPTSPRTNGPVSAPSMPSARRWQRLPGERRVDGERAASSRPATAATSRDGIEQADEATRGQHRRRVIGGLAARGSRTGVPPIASASSASSGSERSSPSTATVAPRRPPPPGRGRRTATSGWKLPDCVPAAIAGSRGPGAGSAAGVDERLAAVQAQLAAPARGDRIVGHGQEDRGRPRRARPCASAKARAPGTSCRKRSRRPASRLATAATCQPARAKRDAQRRADTARADDADARPAVVRLWRARAGGRARAETVAVVVRVVGSASVASVGAVRIGAADGRSRARRRSRPVDRACTRPARHRARDPRRAHPARCRPAPPNRLRGPGGPAS